MSKTITVAAAATQDALETNGSDVEAVCETVKEARAKARYYISAEYARASQCDRLGYARVQVNGECVYDVFA